MIKRRLITSFLFLALVGCGGGGGGGTPPAPTYDAFGSPEIVVISNYTSDVMEPFISRDEDSYDDE